MGQVPMWYRVIRASRYLGTAPWDLAKAPLFWLQAAEQAQTAEASAEQMREQRKKNPTGRGARSRGR
jgi:hypothetical protein